MYPIYTKNRTIGLLGGSFNPAHEGHLHITLHALNKLHFDEVWWLVSPQNPLKSTADMAEYDKRFASALQVAGNHRRVRVLDIETRFRTRFTYQTITLIKAHFPGTYFVWMMGADNLAQFHRWQHWQDLLREIPVVVFDRSPYSHTSLRSKAMLRARKNLLKDNGVAFPMQGQAFIFEHLKRSPLSSTYLRKTLGISAFLRHN